MARVTLSAVNAELKRRGHAERLVRGRWYFYFIDGRAMAWRSSTVYVAQLSAMTVEEWANRRDELADA